MLAEVKCTCANAHIPSILGMPTSAATILFVEMATADMHTHGHFINIRKDEHYTSQLALVLERFPKSQFKFVVNNRISRRILRL